MRVFDQIDIAVENERMAYDRKVKAYHVVAAQRLLNGSGVPDAEDLAEEFAAINAWVEAKAKLAVLLTHYNPSAGPAPMDLQGRAASS